jgi:hypothetical protein
MGRTHYSYDRDAGRERGAHDVNRLFERNGMAFELTKGEAVRTAPAVLHEALAATVFKTRDQALDQLLEAARQKFLNHALDVRRESLEKLWDAWERLKTLEPGKDKKASTSALLRKAAAEPFRARLDQEARELTANRCFVNCTNRLLIGGDSRTRSSNWMLQAATRKCSRCRLHTRGVGCCLCREGSSAEGRSPRRCSSSEARPCESLVERWQRVTQGRSKDVGW